jgi:hypothetical protein
MVGPGDDYITSDDVDPIFSKKNFDMSLKVVGEAYEALRPALALATKLITTDEVLGWWIHVLYGSVQVDASGKRYLA